MYRNQIQQLMQEQENRKDIKKEEHLVKKYTIFFGLAIVLLIIAFVLIIVGITSNDEYWICGIFAIGGALAFLFSGIKVYCDKERFFGKTSKENVEDNKVVAKQLPQHMVLNSFARNILNEMKVIIRESEKTLDKWNYLSCEEYLLNDFKKAFLKNPPYLKEGQKFVYRI